MPSLGCFLDPPCRENGTHITAFQRVLLDLEIEHERELAELRSRLACALGMDGSMDMSMSDEGCAQSHEPWHGRVASI